MKTLGKDAEPQGTKRKEPEQDTNLDGSGETIQSEQTSNDSEPDTAREVEKPDTGRTKGRTKVDDSEPPAKKPKRDGDNEDRNTEVGAGEDAGGDTDRDAKESKELE